MPFLPFDDAKAQEFSDRLSRTMFRSPKDFVDVYNDEMISRRHEKVQQTLTELLNTYRDVRLVGSKLVFVSEDELLFDEVMASLRVYETAVKMKREVQDLVAKGVLSGTDTILFAPGDTGYVLQAVFDNDDPEAEPVYERAEGATRLFRKQEDALEVHNKLRLGTIEDEDQVAIHVDDLKALDTSFVKKIHSEIPA